jgi:hypothetical protein
MSALDALIEDSLPLIRTSHLSGHVVHLLAGALRAVLVDNDLFRALIELVPLLSRLHPLLSLVELLLIDDLVPRQVCYRRQLLAKTALRVRLVRAKGEQHAASTTKHG